MKSKVKSSKEAKKVGNKIKPKVMKVISFLFLSSHFKTASNLYSKKLM